MECKDCGAKENVNNITKLCGNCRWKRDKAKEVEIEIERTKVRIEKLEKELSQFAKKTEVEDGN